MDIAMSIDIRTLSLIISLITTIEVVVLVIQYQKEKKYKGFLWWIFGIGLIGLHFLSVFMNESFQFGVAALLIDNLFLTAGFLVLLHATLHFFNLKIQGRLYFLFGVLYTFLIITAYSLGNIALPMGITALSVALFSALVARIIYKQKFSSYKLLAFYNALAFLINAVFFIIYAISWFFFTNITQTELPTAIQEISYVVLSAITTFLTFGFIFLMDHRLNRDTLESKEKYTLMFETIPDAVLITRLKDGLFVEVNQVFTDLSGYSANEIRGKTTLDIDIWFYPVERNKFVILLTESGFVDDMEFQFRRKNGRPLIGLLSARAIDIDGIPHILSVVRDITSRKKMEEKLRENEQKYRFLAENSCDVIWHINKSHRIDYISPADEVIRGFKREEVIGTLVWSVFKPEGIQLVREKIEHHAQVEQIGNNMNVTRFEIEQRCKDGSWIWTEITAAPHYDQQGNLVGYHGISRDITEQKQLMDKLYEQATIDELTQIPNRRHFMDLATIELRRAKRYHHPLSIAVIDFNTLKKINDSHGHLAGDRALSVFTKIVQQIVRDVDVIGRFGGDEFLLLLPETDKEQATRVLERIQNVLASSPVFYGDKNFTVSISVGVASIENWTDTLEDLFNRADAALYLEKGCNGNGTRRQSF